MFLRERLERGSLEPRTSSLGGLRLRYTRPYELEHLGLSSIFGDVRAELGWNPLGEAEVKPTALHPRLGRSDRFTLLSGLGKPRGGCHW